MSLAIVAASALGLLGCTQEKAGPLEGAWELVDAKYTPDDPTFSLAKRHHIKLLTKTHWAFLDQAREPATSANGSDFSAGGGTYKLDGDTYTEHIEFFVVPKYVGTSITFKVKWDGDEWIQTGTLPLKALGMGDHDVELQERYRRVK